MSSRLFGTTSDYARFSGTPPVTAAPLTMLVAGQSSSIAAQQVFMLLVNGAAITDDFRLAVNSSSGTWQFGVQGSGSGNAANSTNAISLNTPFIGIGRTSSSTSRQAILNGNIASMGTNATSLVPASLNRLTFGKRDSSANTFPVVGNIFYGALWNASLSDEECIALGLYGAPPALIRPGALLCYWPNFGRSNGTTIIDVLGRCPLTITGGSDSLIAMRRWMPDIGEVGTPSSAEATNSAAAGSARFSATAVPFEPPVSGSVLLEDGLELLLESGDPVLLETDIVAVSASASARLAQTTVAASRKNAASATAGWLTQRVTAPSTKKAFVAVALEASRTSATVTRGAVAQASAAVAAARMTASAPITTGRRSVASGRHAQTAVVIGALVSGTSLLLEDNNDLLLESGEPLLLETAVAAPSSVAVGSHTQTGIAPARKGGSSASIARHERSMAAAPSFKRAASAATGRHAAAAVSGTSTKRAVSAATGRHAPLAASGTSRKQATTLVLAVTKPTAVASRGAVTKASAASGSAHWISIASGSASLRVAMASGRAAGGALTGASRKIAASAAQGAARTRGQATAIAAQTTASSGAGGQRATVTAPATTTRAAISSGAARSGAVAADTTGRSPLAIGAIRSAAGAIDTTSRRTSAVAASTGKAQAGPSVAKHISAASSGSLRAKAAVISTTTRSTAVARGAARISVEQPIFLSAKGTLHLSAAAAAFTAARRATAIAAAATTSVATDTTRRSSGTATGAAAGRATAPQGNARQSTAAGTVRGTAVGASKSNRSALARGAARTSAVLPTFLSVKISLRLSATATNLAAVRQAAGIAAAKLIAIAIDTTARTSQASGAAATKATAPQGNARQSAAVGRVRSAAAVISTTTRSTALARGSGKTSVEQPIFLSAKGRLRQSALATSLAASRQSSAIAAARAVATALDTTARTSQTTSGGAIIKATAVQANVRQSTAVGRTRVAAVVASGTTVRSTALAKGSAKANAVQPRFPSVKSAGKQSAVAASTAQRAATAVARQASRATVASGQATRTAPTLYVIAGTDVVATPGLSHRATSLARGSARTGGIVASGVATRRSTSVAAMRFSAIGIQIPPEVIWLRGRRESTQLRGKYGNGSMSGQSTVIALRGRR